MIGIALRSREDWIVREFFELFKTPWEWFRPGNRYDVVICNDLEDSFPGANLVIVIQRGNSAVSADEGRRPATPIWLEHREIAFPVYSQPDQIHNGQSIVSIKGKGVCVASNNVIEGKTVIHLGYDFFDEASFLLNRGQPISCAGIPTLDHHINNLRGWILKAGAPLIEIPPVANNSKFFACLTHDIDFAGIRHHLFDRTAAGFVFRAIVKSTVQYFKGQYSLDMLLRNWRAVAELPLVYMGLRKDPWNTLREYRNIEGNAPSTFYFVPYRGLPGRTKNGAAPSIRAVKYNVKTLRGEIQELAADGCEIGVHGIDSWTDTERGKLEMTQIRELIGEARFGVRMHWLYFDAESPVTLENAGYSYDSTCGYNETVGYRAGTLQVFKPQGTHSLLELPMHIMDSALFYPDRLNMTLSEGVVRIGSLINNAAQSGGVLTLNWHDRSIAPERLWDNVYRGALNAMRDKKACFLSAQGVVDWFRKRRSVAFNFASEKTNDPSIIVSGSEINPEDGMVLRVYSAANHGSQQESGDHCSRVYQDFLLGEKTTLEVRP